MSQTMRAVQINQYGGAEQLLSVEIPVSVVSDDEVLVKVHAAAINPVDWKVREGYLAEMLQHTLPLTLGWDFAGQIVEVGKAVSGWAVGDKVYSRPNISRNGSYAEYIAVNSQEIAKKPRSLNWQEAAAVPLAALTAWQAFFDVARLKKGERVLIQAGAGGVGGFAIQLAKYVGAYVYTTASAANSDYVKSLGADEVIDYHTHNVGDLRDLDVVLDTLGGESLTQIWQTLKPGGRLVSIVGTPDQETAKEYNLEATFHFVQPNRTQLDQISELIDANKISVTIDSVFPLEDAAKAHAKSESHRARGKIILAVADQ